jgi:L-seryl-tRNA(Ser) seleniumtransferase
MADTARDALRALPSVDSVLQTSAAITLVEHHGHPAAAAAVRQTLEALRKAILDGTPRDAGACSPDAVAAAAEATLAAQARPRLRRVVNATGIILHTGLGRAFMPDESREALAAVTGYCNLQQDLATGQRDRREECLRDLVCELTGAEDVLVVNNNAGATLLVLAALARGKEVVISRGELIEIGGSFRLPDIMRESGAVLREVGTTNKTHLRDYAAAVGPATGLILKAHKSNYKIVGFTDEVTIGDIVAVGRKAGVSVVDDLGCGALVGLEAFGLEHEGTVQESLAAGADIALFSTDKLIGGPQGGMIVGRRALIDRIQAHPLYRALRVGKLTLAALEATLRLFRAPDRLAQRHPVYMMLAKTPEAMEAQADRLAGLIRARQPAWEVGVGKETSYLGGGTLPAADLPSYAVRIRTPDLSADEVSRRLRRAAVPVVPRVHADWVILDMRTVLPADTADVVAAVAGLTS